VYLKFKFIVSMLNEMEHSLPPFHFCARI
jgi:hypothetical protein